MNAMLFAALMVFLQFGILVCCVGYFLFEKYNNQKKRKESLLELSAAISSEYDSRKDALNKFLKTSLQYDDESVKLVAKDIMEAEKEYYLNFIELFDNKSSGASALLKINEQYIHIATLYQALLPQAPVITDDVAELVNQANENEEDIEQEEYVEQEGAQTEEEDIASPSDDIKGNLIKELRVVYLTHLESKGLLVSKVRSDLSEIRNRLGI